jgi:hypothetical protein
MVLIVEGVSKLAEMIEAKFITNPSLEKDFKK